MKKGMKEKEGREKGSTPFPRKWASILPPPCPQDFLSECPSESSRGAHNPSGLTWGGSKAGKRGTPRGIVLESYK